MGTNPFFRYCVTAVAATALTVCAAPLTVRAENPPLPEVRIETATDLGVVTPPRGILGRDGGYSVRYGDTSFWIYGDTLIRGRQGQEPGLISNSWSWTEDLCAADGIDGMAHALDDAKSPMPIFPLTDDEQAFNRAHQPARCTQEPCGTRWALWPGALVADPARGRLLAFYEKVLVGSKPFDFQIAGHAVAVWSDIRNPVHRPVFREGEKDSSLMFAAGEPGFGSGALTIDEMLFAFGCDREGMEKPCRLARVPLKTVLERKTWRFYSGPNAWTADIEKSTTVFSGNDILSVSYNGYLRRFLAVYARPMGRSVMVRTAPAPRGPWSAPAVAFEAKPPASETGWIYDALEHPEYAEEEGRRIFITYSRQTGPESFEQRLVAVRISRPGTPRLPATKAIEKGQKDLP